MFTIFTLKKSRLYFFLNFPDIILESFGYNLITDLHQFCITVQVHMGVIQTGHHLNSLTPRAAAARRPAVAETLPCSP